MTHATDREAIPEPQNPLGVDGIEFIEAERLIPLFDRNMRATHLNVQLTETEIALSLITR